MAVREEGRRTAAVVIEKKIKDWLRDMERGLVRLPDFQREMVWSHELISGFIQAMLQERPLGFFLVLQVDPSEQPFATRAVAGASDNGEECREHLLDGQQRLTALWRSFKGDPKREFYVKFSVENDGTYRLEDIESLPKTRTRKWIGQPKEEFKREYMPLTILDPENGARKASDWKRAALDESKNMTQLEVFIDSLRSIVSSTGLWYFALPQGTSAEEAIDIFIEVNRSSVRLAPFDIAVAQFKAETGSDKTLRDKVKQLESDEPRLTDLEGETGTGDLVLKVACAHQDKKPTFKHYRELDFVAFDDNWATLESGLKWAAEFLDEEFIWRAQQLPSKVPLRVLPGLCVFLPTGGDNEGKARRLLRSYLWRSFTTGWYSRQANDRLLEDFRFLKNALSERKFSIPSPAQGKGTVFGETLPETDDLLDEGWPKQSGILRRSILAVTLAQGALDLETERAVSASNIKEHQYHHIFPQDLLEKHAKSQEPNLALNCMLLEGKTNRNWSNAWPGDYIRERIAKAGANGGLSQELVEKRLKSHMVPVKEILEAKEGSNIAEVYQKFLEVRAKIVHEAIIKLCKKGAR